MSEEFGDSVLQESSAGVHQSYCFEENGAREAGDGEEQDISHQCQTFTGRHRQKTGKYLERNARGSIGRNPHSAKDTEKKKEKFNSVDKKNYLKLVWE